MTSFTSQYKTLEKDYLIDIINKNQWEDETMLVMIDNYDSFTYSLYQYFGELGTEVFTLRNDQTSIEEIEDLKDPNFVSLNSFIISFIRYLSSFAKSIMSFIGNTKPVGLVIWERKITFVFEDIFFETSSKNLSFDS